MSAVIRQRTTGEPRIISNGEPTILAEGRIGAIVKIPVLVDEGEGYIEKVFEKFVRPPGTRIIALDNQKIYLQQEARLERNNIPDWRLPGGKVVDNFEMYKQYLTKTIPEELIIEAGAKELAEEAALTADNFTIFAKKDCGATVEWDLYYIVASGVRTREEKNTHNEGEDIHKGHWFTFDEILAKCASGEISEGRTVAALFEFIRSRQSSSGE